MILVWQIIDNSSNSTNFPTIPYKQYSQMPFYWFIEFPTYAYIVYIHAYLHLMTHNDILPGGPPVDMGLIDAIRCT